MTLLDRFRAHPRQKHSDPVVRLAFVQEIPIDERDVLAEIAREDADARVRRAAVAKLMDPPALAAVAASDADEGVRDEALTMLRDIALDAFEGLAESESLAAVEALSDTKTLAAVAKTALREEVALRALGRVGDGHTLGSIARHARLEPIRLAALAALRDRAEILGVALNSEFKDTAVAAVERLGERVELEQVAARGKNKSAGKRARGLLRERDERAAAQAAGHQPQAAPSDLANLSEPARLDDDERVPRLEAEQRAETEQRAEEDARLQEARRAQMEAAQADAVRKREQTQALERQPLLEQAEHKRERDAERRRGRLAELLQEAEAAAADHDLVAARRRLSIVGLEWKDLTTVAGIDGDVAERHAAAEARLAAREMEAQAQETRTRQEALARLTHLAGRVEALAAKADLTLKAGERALRDIRSALGGLPPLLYKHEVVHTLKTAQSALMPKVQELRDAADWQRWANLGLQEKLCAKMEALGAINDPPEVARQIRELQQQWRQASDVPRVQGEELWRRFKAAHDVAWARLEAHFAAEAAARAENLSRKTVLCEQAEALADSSNWIQAAEEIKRLQAEWKSVGGATHGQEKVIWERFRTACDRFFTRRHADLTERKKTWAANLAKKDALCAQVEALADSTDWDATAASIKRLQAEWKTIGPVKKTRSEAIWQRFRGACDRFFTRYAHRHELARGERVTAREALCAELESLAPAESAVASPDAIDRSDVRPDVASGSGGAEDLVTKVRGLRARWGQESAERGVDRERAAALDQRFAAAFTRVIAGSPGAFTGTDLDPDANRKRMDILVRRMEELAGSLGGATGAIGDAALSALSPTTRLAAMLRDALAANTIGGKVDDDSRMRAAAEEVREAQASWARVGPVPDDVRRTLSDRFARACRRITETVGGAGQRGGAGGGTTGKAGKAGR